MPNERRILIVDDDDLVRERLSSIVSTYNFEPTSVADAEAALRLAAKTHFDVFFVDIQLPETDGFELMARLRETAPGTPIVIITSYGDVASAITALRAGAFDFLAKPVQPETLLLCLERIFQIRALDAENRELRKADREPKRLGPLIATSNALKDILSVVKRVADSVSTVLLTGESGTGKDVVARALHEASIRSSRPFLPINCAALPHDLLESELFGHSKGAFTGATSERIGLLAQGHGGTVFLDEISEMEESLQTKLLMFLQNREVRPLGSTRTHKVDIRIIAASNRDLARDVREGRFRQDLYYRLNVIPITIPPLRERTADILPLAQHFLERLGGSERRLGNTAITQLEKAYWAGNVRELKNVIERTLALSNADVIEADDLFIEDADLLLEGENGLEELVAFAVEETAPLRNIEERYIHAVLRRVDGNKMKAARILGVNRTTLYRRKDAES